jgi:serine/threonine-protein kinase
MLASAAAVLLGILLTYGVPFAPDEAARDTAQAVATSSSGPGVSAPESATPSTSASPSGSPSSSSSPDASPTTATPTDGTSATASASPAGAGTTAPAGTGGTTAPPTGTPPTEPTAPAVKDVALSGFTQTGPMTATATVVVTTDGTGPVSVTVSWSTGNLPGVPGAADGAAQTFTRSGATQYTIPVDHTFQNRGCYWTVQATTDPAAAGGTASQQLLTRQCDLR